MRKSKPKPKESLRLSLRDTIIYLGLSFGLWLGEMHKLDPSYTRTPEFREFYWRHYLRFRNALNIHLQRYPNRELIPWEGDKHEAKFQPVESQGRRLAS